MISWHSPLIKGWIKKPINDYWHYSSPTKNNFSWTENFRASYPTRLRNLKIITSRLVHTLSTMAFNPALQWIRLTCSLRQCLADIQWVISKWVHPPRRTKPKRTFLLNNLWIRKWGLKIFHPIEFSTSPCLSTTWTKSSAITVSYWITSQSWLTARWAPSVSCQWTLCRWA